MRQYTYHGFIIDKRRGCRYQAVSLDGSVRIEHRSIDALRKRVREFQPPSIGAPDVRTLRERQFQYFL